MKKIPTAFYTLVAFLAAVTISWGYFEPIPEVPPPNPDWKQVSTPFFRELDGNVSVLKVELEDELEFGRFAEMTVIKLNPAAFKFDIQLELNKSNQMRISKLAQTQNAMLTINGGFFDKDFKPEGLLISRGKVLNPKGERGSGVLYITRDGKPDIAWVKDFEPGPEIEFAIQAGPIIVEKPSKSGIKYPRMKRHARSTVGITEAGELFFIHVRKGQDGNRYIDGLTLHELVLILLDESLMAGLKPYCVLNLDGGSSAGLYMEHPKAKLYFRELAKVSNIILVKKK